MSKKTSRFNQIYNCKGFLEETTRQRDQSSFYNTTILLSGFYDHPFNWFHTKMAKRWTNIHKISAVFFVNVEWVIVGEEGDGRKLSKDGVSLIHVWKRRVASTQCIWLTYMRNSVSNFYQFQDGVPFNDVTVQLITILSLQNLYINKSYF